MKPSIMHIRKIFAPENVFSKTADNWKRILSIGAVCFACFFFCVRGYEDQRVALQSIDYKPIYGAAKCILAGCDPYDRRATQSEYLKSGGDAKDLTAFRSYYLSYPPNMIFLTLPLALVPWPIANLAWLILICGAFVAGVAAISNLCFAYSPLLSAGVIVMFVITSLMLVMLAQPAALAIGLCCIAIWCFMRNRFVKSGIVCLALSVVCKPHLCAPVLLYFLLSGGVNRLRAWRVIAFAIIVSIPGLMWVSLMPQSRGWVGELSANLVGMAQKGDLSDPGPTNSQAADLSNLQTIFSLARDDRNFYNVASWMVTLALLLAWSYPAVRAKAGLEKDLLCIAAITAIGLLPIVHRTYDTRLLLLTFPALAWLLLRQHGWGLTALLLNCAMTLMTFSQVRNSRVFHFIGDRLSADTMHNIAFRRPVSVACLAMAIFYSICCYVILLRRELRLPLAQDGAREILA